MDAIRMHVFCSLFFLDYGGFVIFSGNNLNYFITNMFCIWNIELIYVCIFFLILITNF